MTPTVSEQSRPALQKAGFSVCAAVKPAVYLRPAMAFKFVVMGLYTPARRIATTPRFTPSPPIARRRSGAARPFQSPLENPK